MTVNTNIAGTLETAQTIISNTSTTTVLEPEGDQRLVVQRILYASASGDTITFDTYDGTTASRLHQWELAANEDGAYPEEFVLRTDDVLRATLTTGNTTVVRVAYLILP